MRKILGMNQKEYAKKVAAISPRMLSEFEKGSGNLFHVKSMGSKSIPPFRMNVEARSLSGL
jgi:hypothetical protein